MFGFTNDKSFNMCSLCYLYINNLKQCMQFGQYSLY